MRLHLVSLALLFLFALACQCTGAPADAAPRTLDSAITVTGYLEDSENAGTIEISVAGATGDYVNYVIAEKGKGRDLKKLVGQLVKLSGTIQTDKKKTRTLLVEKYEVLKSLPGDSGLPE
jgi:hypothetical protein